MNDTCPVCDHECVMNPPYGGNPDVQCKTCGNYSITGFLRNSLPPNKKHVLSGVLREASDNGNPITINFHKIQDIIDSASVPGGQLASIDRIIVYIDRHASTDASGVTFISDKDYPIAFAENSGVFSYYLNKAVEIGYLELKSGRYRLDLKGWERLEELKKIQPDSDKAFVAMWFHEKMDDVWKKGIKPALKEVGFKPFRIKDIKHNDKICDRIISEIRKSGLLIADFTGNRGGVYFEAALAMGLGIPVIWTACEKYIKRIHFNTRQYNHIFWKDPEDLKEQLIERIEATVPNRPKRSSN